MTPGKSIIRRIVDAGIGTDYLVLTGRGHRDTVTFRLRNAPTCGGGPGHTIIDGKKDGNFVRRIRRDGGLVLTGTGHGDTGKTICGNSHRGPLRTVINAIINGRRISDRDILTGGRHGTKTTNIRGLLSPGDTIIQRDVGPRGGTDDLVETRSRHSNGGTDEGRIRNLSPLINIIKRTGNEYSTG